MCSNSALGEETKISGIVRPGHQIASGNAKDSPYPKGSIEMQVPFFKALGLDLSAYFLGTININIAPAVFEVITPKYTFEKVQWIEGFPPETFSFFDCVLQFNGQKYAGLVYYPHPETKTQHFHNNSVLEVLAPKIDSLHYEASIILEYQSSQLLMRKPSSN
ncbi:MAG: hypothetical protein GJ680_02235 [Alteromonadaceae bacterium]|nr:hypothetical protein [Alteromonadaceae bacterium]